MKKEVYVNLKCYSNCDGIDNFEPEVIGKLLSPIQ